MILGGAAGDGDGVGVDAETADFDGVPATCKAGTGVGLTVSSSGQGMEGPTWGREGEGRSGTGVDVPDRVRASRRALAFNALCTSSRTWESRMRKKNTADF